MHVLSAWVLVLVRVYNPIAAPLAVAPPEWLTSRCVSPRAAFAPGAASIASRVPALAQCKLPVTKARPAAGMTVTMAEGRDAAGDLSRDLGKMASALALSALLMLPSGAMAKEQLGGNFKVLQGAASTQVAPAAGLQGLSANLKRTRKREEGLTGAGSGGWGGTSAPLLSSSNPENDGKWPAMLGRFSSDFYSDLYSDLYILTARLAVNCLACALTTARTLSRRTRGRGGRSRAGRCWTGATSPTRTLGASASSRACAANATFPGTLFFCIVPVFLKRAEISPPPSPAALEMRRAALLCGRVIRPLSVFSHCE